MHGDLRQVLAVLVCSISCLATPSTGCTFEEVRLVGGAHQYEGMVEYCTASGQWSTICDSPLVPWTDFTARLACNAAGLGIVTNATKQSCANSTFVQNGTSIYCDKTALHINDCSTASANCSHSTMATCTVQNYCTHIKCPNNSECVEELDHIPCSPCQCAEGWAGTNCDLYVPTEDQHVPTENNTTTGYTTTVLCVPPCSNGGTCMAPNTCQCLDGTLREHCEQTTAPILCDGSFCLNGGTCLHPNHTCTCSENWTGERCEEELQDSSNIVVIAVAVVAALLALLAAASLVIAIGITCRHRRRANDDMEMTQGDTTREKSPIENQDNISYGIMIRQQVDDTHQAVNQGKDTNPPHGYPEMHQNTSQKDGGSSQGTGGAYYSVIRDETATNDAKEVVYSDPQFRQDKAENKLPENADEVLYDYAHFRQGQDKSGLLPTAEYANVGIGLTGTQGDHNMTPDYIKMNPGLLATHYATLPNAEYPIQHSKT